MQANPRRFSFLLRVWLAGNSDPPQWRASLENIHTGELRGFASLEELCRLLLALADEGAENKPTNRKPYERF